MTDIMPAPVRTTQESIIHRRVDGAMVNSRYRILAPTRYPWSFNGPRRSRNVITRRNFVPFNKISNRIEGVTILNGLSIQKFDLVHAFNRIPIGRLPYVIGFESHLPRAFGNESGAVFRIMRSMLKSPRCRGIVAISEHAADIFRRQHIGMPDADAIFRKLTTRYPNVEIGAPPLPRLVGERPLHISFVGNHFARKGGCVAVSVAEMALAARLPVRFTIVSALQAGGKIWTDPENTSFFESYFKLLKLPNVCWRSQLPNSEVQDLLRDSDLSLLTTFGDTCGFSAIESLAQGTPVIATAQGALPEMIEHDKSGFVLPLPTNEIREWIHLGATDRGSTRFERIFSSEVERLSTDVLALIKDLVHRPERLFALRLGAYNRACSMFGAREANVFWDDYYQTAITSNSN